MREFIQEQIDEFDWWLNTQPNATVCYQQGRVHIERIAEKALQDGCPAVLEACQRPGYGIKHTQLVLAACLAACPEPQSDTLSVPDVAKEIKTSEDTIRDWIKSGQLKASNVATGNRPRYLVQRDDLNAFLKFRQIEPPLRKRKRTR